MLRTEICSHQTVIDDADAKKSLTVEDDETVDLLTNDERKSIRRSLKATHDHKNPIIKALIENRKAFDSWAEAAGAVFSDSHPFTMCQRNDRSDTERNDSSRDRENICSESDMGVVQKHTEEREVNERQDAGYIAPNKEQSEGDEGPKEAIQSCKTPSPKSNDEKKNCRRKRSVSRHKSSSYINSDRLSILKSKVESAVKEHKVYSMTGHYSSVRKALKERGWMEKIDSDLKGRRRTFKVDDTDGALVVTGKGEGTSSNEQFEAEIVNRMLRNITEDLCWLSKPYPYCWKDINKCDMINRLPKAYFSNKVGLANSLANMHWYYEEGVCTTQYPRTFNISARDELEALQDDFRLTACISTLKWLTSNYKQGGESAVWSTEGRVDTNIVDFSIKRCAEYVKFKEHEDIDTEDGPRTWDHQWDHFLTQFYKLVNEGNILRQVAEDPPIMTVVSKAQASLSQLKPHWPQMDIDGINNWWIVKPGGRCCGNGILIRNNLDQILAIVNPTVTKETRYVVQKYIEKPLLIYNTKFDIRQWFLVTNVYPLTIWMYKESYLRFCSSTYNLKNMHESIHLCNNAVQRRYKNGKRDRNLPDENMWDCYTFQTHLRTIGYPDAWDQLIYPGMRESFVGALLTSQDNMERRRNCFELYGADFMITQHIVDGPWLIEINSNPAMDASTSVTARMCPQVLEDIIKVVIDRRNDKNASTGAFELAYRQNCPPIPPYLGMSLCIKGKKCSKLSETRNPRRPNFQNKSSESDESSSSDGEVNIVQRRCCTDFMQPIKTLRDEIQRLGNEREFLIVRNENHSDSWAHDSDTSRCSTDRRMALEGKEIELRKKKNRRKRHKHSQNSYVNKPQANHIGKTKSDTPKNNNGMMVRARSVRNDIRDKKEGRTQNATFGEDLTGKPIDSESTEVTRPLIITGLWDPEFADGEGKRSSLSPQGLRAGNFDRTVYLRVSSSRDSLRSSASSLAESSDAAEPGTGRHSKRNKYSEIDLATTLSITAPEWMVKGRKKGNRWSASKSSMDYFREWKYKIEETRRNCEDVLTKLKCFKENNSRKKFQDLIRQKAEEENRTTASAKKENVSRNGEVKTHKLNEDRKYTRQWTTNANEGVLQASATTTDRIIASRISENVRAYEALPRIKAPKTTDRKKIDREKRDNKLL